jgi:hypothetical protein
MMSVRRLDWDNAVQSGDRIAVPLDGGPDDYWLDRFHEARSRAKSVRASASLPHLQIELRGGAITATGICDGEHESVRGLLSGLVASANNERSAPRSLAR